jgi:hypothetical protein
VKTAAEPRRLAGCSQIDRAQCGEPVQQGGDVSIHDRVEARDRGLAQISRLTSLALSGGLLLSGAFAVLAGHAYAGHGRRSTAPPASGSALPSGTPVAPLGTPTTVPQAIPPSVPQYTYVPPVVSGGS